MMNFTGYFLLASKFGGLTRKPWTLSLLAPGNQKGSRGCIETSDNTGSLRETTISPVVTAEPMTSWGADTVPFFQYQRSCDTISLGYSDDICVESRCFPSGVIAKSSLTPPTSSCGSVPQSPASVHAKRVS